MIYSLVDFYVNKFLLNMSKYSGAISPCRPGTKNTFLGSLIGKLTTFTVSLPSNLVVTLITGCLATYDISRICIACDASNG